MTDFAKLSLEILRLIASITGMNKQVVRNMLRKREKKSFALAEIKVVGRALLASGVPSQASESREVCCRLAVSNNALFEKYGDTVVKWTRNAIGDITMDLEKTKRDT